MEIMKIGDKVRFLSEVGGGVVTGFRGKDIVLVEDADGFDIPMPVRECVVIETDDYNIPTPASKAAKKKAGREVNMSSVTSPWRYNNNLDWSRTGNGNLAMRSSGNG